MRGAVIAPLAAPMTHCERGHVRPLAVFDSMLPLPPAAGECEPCIALQIDQEARLLPTTLARCHG